jgi:hypothetical protein
MVTRIEKSSKLRNNTEYLLLWRLAKAVGQKTVDSALRGNTTAIDKIERFAWKGKKKPALVKWVEKQREQAKR